MERVDKTIPRIAADVCVKSLRDWHGSKPMIAYRKRRWVVHSDVISVVEVLQEAEGTAEEVALRASSHAGRAISEERVLEIVRDYLNPNGMISGTDPPRSLRSDRILWRVQIPLPERTILAERLMQPFLKKWWAIVAILLMFTVRAVVLVVLPWSSFVRLPALLLSTPWIYGIIVVWFISLMIHELGHVIAARKQDVRVPSVGFGFYWGSPVFFADLNELWFSPPARRIVVNLAGIYYQSMVVTLLYLIGLMFSWRYGVWSAVAFDIMSFSNLNPLLKYDGYWILTDLLGTYNMRSVKLIWMKTWKNPRDWITLGYQIFSWAYVIVVLWLLGKGITDLINEISHMTSAKSMSMSISTMNLISIIIFLAGVASLLFVWLIRAVTFLRRLSIRRVQRGG